MMAHFRFLSTLSLRRATQQAAISTKCGGYFYPRSPCGERHTRQCCAVGPVTISIHALLAESDTIFAVRPYDAPIFLSTLSLRRATYGRINDISRLIFLSTLSLRRATGCQRPFGRPTKDFYPRSPCGERRAPRFTPAASRNFYPRSPCGERRPEYFLT